MVCRRFLERLKLGDFLLPLPFLAFLQIGEDDAAYLDDCLAALGRQAAPKEALRDLVHACGDVALHAQPVLRDGDVDGLAVGF